MKKIILIFILLFSFNVKALDNVENINNCFNTVDMCNFLYNDINLIGINFNNTVENLDNNSIEIPNTGVKVNYTMYIIVFIGIIILKKIYNYSKK